MLRLLERLAEALLAGRSRGPISLDRIALHDDSIEFELSVRQWTWLMDGRYVLEARIVDTAPDETRCAIRLSKGRSLGRIAGKALTLLPEGWVNPFLGRWLPGVRREGGDVVVSHRHLARALLHRGR